MDWTCLGGPTPKSRRKTTNKTDMIIDPATIPCWLTGEEGTSCGVIKEGKFSKTL